MPIPSADRRRSEKIERKWGMVGKARSSRCAQAEMGHAFALPTLPRHVKIAVLAVHSLPRGIDRAASVSTSAAVATAVTSAAVAD